MATSETDSTESARVEAWRARNPTSEVGKRPGMTGENLEVAYMPEDLASAQEARDIGLPGQFPYTRGVYPAMYRDRLWQMRLYSGFGDAESTNERWKFLLAHGNNGVSAAFDLPTQCGLDSDHPDALSEVGRVGVAVDCVRDFERMFTDLPADRMGVSLNAHSTAPFVFALWLVAMERAGIEPGRLNGSMTTDVLKDYV